MQISISFVFFWKTLRVVDLRSPRLQESLQNSKGRVFRENHTVACFFESPIITSSPSLPHIHTITAITLGGPLSATRTLAVRDLLRPTFINQN